ncbi:hypothetical protein GCM10007989_01450 [Devosia pacifica]|uniref:Uncharacterized protein n=1 Tax=Devosia pacifica TaxID=1335967 RepID=A0A918RTW7_9HYPH|nr:hypothetical protein [Devosia pacifica]GHA10881.1 hypothetical protein GCM10007989_01450 [Devosia pacifica]
MNTRSSLLAITAALTLGVSSVAWAQVSVDADADVGADVGGVSADVGADAGGSLTTDDDDTDDNDNTDGVSDDDDGASAGGGTSDDDAMSGDDSDDMSEDDDMDDEQSDDGDDDAMSGSDDSCDDESLESTIRMSQSFDPAMLSGEMTAQIVTVADCAQGGVTAALGTNGATQVQQEIEENPELLQILQARGLNQSDVLGATIQGDTLVIYAQDDDTLLSN